jgi:hypothetical protein
MQAAAVTLLLPQDAEGRLGPASRLVAAACGGSNGSRSRTSAGVTRRQLLHCVAQFYAAQLTPEAHVAAMQVHPGCMPACVVLMHLHVYLPSRSPLASFAHPRCR